MMEGRGGDRTNSNESPHLQAYSMLDMKVTGFTHRTMSMIYTTTVGKVEAWGQQGTKLMSPFSGYRPATPGYARLPPVTPSYSQLPLFSDQCFCDDGARG